ncbi:hypothetical protein BTUL_0223g00120 [Botrytis tulipae]|uniref:Uncharacterized protein n=1 Tax=Botrytis tulipae TaxID=87230 RepID=A0A4Z1E7V1_9HELO|nr:hypothetical protein BTUL_0223g00120 [Botrytis tulipae]
MADVSLGSSSNDEGCLMLNVRAWCKNERDLEGPCITIQDICKVAAGKEMLDFNIRESTRVNICGVAAVDTSGL